MTTDLPLTPEDVEAIIAILERTPYERVEVCTNRFRLSISRSESGWVQAWEWPLGTVEPAAEQAGEAEEPVKAPDDEAGDGLCPVRAPLPGTFYHAPQPGAPPFVEVGSLVRPDTVVGIIETMKLMTPVHAGVTGTVVAIVVDNAIAVDADAVLLRVKAGE